MCAVLLLLLLVLLCARAAVCVCVCTIACWRGGMFVGVQISFEWLIWNKVAQGASRAVILFPNVREQHL